MLDAEDNKERHVPVLKDSKVFDQTGKSKNIKEDMKKQRLRKD